MESLLRFIFSLRMDFTSRKTRRMQIRVLLEFNLKLVLRKKRTYSRWIRLTPCLWYSIKCQTRGVPEVICAQKHTTTCMSGHNSRWLLTLCPETIP